MLLLAAWLVYANIEFILLLDSTISLTCKMDIIENESSAEIF